MIRFKLPFSGYILASDDKFFLCSCSVRAHYALDICMNNFGARIVCAGNMEIVLTNVREFEELARQALPKMFYDYFRGGAEDEFTLRENIEAFQRIRLNPRVLIDVSSINMSTSLLGFKLSSPILVAPTGGHKFAHPQGEVATARAAAACNTIMVLSFSSSCTIEEVSSSCNAIRFFQLYVYKRRDVSAKVVQKAESFGFKAIVVTVDSPRIGRREADIKNK